MHAVITALPGDGIGPEVVAEGRRVLEAVGERFGHTFDVREALIGGCAIDAVGTALPDETLRQCRESDAVLLRAVGGPKWDNPAASVRPEQGLLGIRTALGLFANLRPVTLHPRLIAERYREIVESLYGDQSDIEVETTITYIRMVGRR